MTTQKQKKQKAKCEEAIVCPFSITNVYQMKRMVFNADIIDTAGMVTPSRHYPHAYSEVGQLFSVMNHTRAVQQDDYCQLSRAASVGVHGYLLLYAINNRESFMKLQIINQKLVDVMGAGNELRRVLVGTKTVRHCGVVLFSASFCP
jgi:hypothetical protein